jgi:hypothetical protein
MGPPIVPKSSTRGHSGFLSFDKHFLRCDSDTAKKHSHEFEQTFTSLADFETSAQVVMSNPEWKAWYQKVLPFVESGYREIFTIVE